MSVPFELIIMGVALLSTYKSPCKLNFTTSIILSHSILLNDWTTRVRVHHNSPRQSPGRFKQKIVYRHLSAIKTLLALEHAVCRPPRPLWDEAEHQSLKRREERAPRTFRVSARVAINMETGTHLFLALLSLGKYFIVFFPSQMHFPLTVS